MKTRFSYVPNKYEKELISYFSEVALKTEFYDTPKKIVKWTKPMKIYIYKGKENENQIKAIKKTIYAINNLVTDGFKIELSNNEKSSNTFIYLCGKDKVAELNPRFYKMFNEDIDYEVSGFVNMRYDRARNVIDEAYIYIDQVDSIEIQQSTILEEITQSLGLANDPTSHPNSIFFENKNEESNMMNEYSKIDRDVIKLLYHPEMKPGLNLKQVNNVIKKIFQEERDKN
ncbi:DUF2927 domain-containing protein [Tenacibaculum sp.]|uniref:DUF2927 domain-containing protein n=1 Tax=Tenacibaculum sp. TaxID=1906242 RepID=UPI003AA89382